MYITAEGRTVASATVQSDAEVLRELDVGAPDPPVVSQTTDRKHELR